MAEAKAFYPEPVPATITLTLTPKEASDLFFIVGHLIIGENGADSPRNSTDAIYEALDGLVPLSLPEGWTHDGRIRFQKKED